MPINQLLSQFNLREIEANLYMKLLSGGLLSATEIARQMNVSRTSVYDLLKRLVEKGLIYETLKGGVKKFAPQPPEKIKLLLDEKEQDITAAKKTLESLNIEYQKMSQMFGPRLQVFEGRASLQQMMKDMLLYRDIEVLAYWPIKNIIETLTPKFLEKFHQERIVRNIKIKVIWPAEQASLVKKFNFLNIDASQKRESRLAPKDINFSLGYSVYGNTTRFISSQKESLGFLIENLELAEMMKGQFNLIWNISKPLK